MRCPYCSELENKVIDSRLAHSGESVRRRRHCEGCQRRYTTYERVEVSIPLIIKKSGSREPFDRDKIMAGLKRSCTKRNISAETLDNVVSSVQRAVVESGEREVSSNFVGRLVLRQLAELDAVAYVRFASVYREFQAVDEFVEELERLSASADEDEASSASLELPPTGDP